MLNEKRLVFNCVFCFWCVLRFFEFLLYRMWLLGDCIFSQIRWESVSKKLKFILNFQVWGGKHVLGIFAQEKGLFSLKEPLGGTFCTLFPKAMEPKRFFPPIYVKNGFYWGMLSPQIAGNAKGRKTLAILTSKKMLRMSARKNFKTKILQRWGQNAFSLGC